MSYRKQLHSNLFRVHSLLLTITSLIPIIFFIDTNFYIFLVSEDHLVEYLTALFLLISFVVISSRIYQSWKNTSVKQKIGLACMGAAMFVGFGEEISWGQRIFELHTPEFFKAYNLQNETNIHNLKIKGVKLNKWVFTYGAMLVFLIYFSSPFLVNRNRRFKKYVVMYGILIPNSRTSVLFLIATVILHSYSVPKISELWEFAFASTLATVCLTQGNNKSQS